MTDLFLDPKVLNYRQDRYELILASMRWARILKGRGSPQPLAELVEKALSDIVEGRVTFEEVMSNKPAPEPPPPLDEAAAAAAAAEEIAAAATDDIASDGEEKKAKAKKKKKDEE